MELKGTVVTYSGFTPSNKNHVTIEVLGMENYFGNVIKSGDEVILKIATEDKKAPEPITISKSDGTGEIEILPEVKKLAIAWIENYVPHNSIVPEIGQKWKLAEDIQRIINQERNRAIQECIEIVKKEQLDTDDHYGYVACANILEKLKK